MFNFNATLKSGALSTSNALIIHLIFFSFLFALLILFCKRKKKDVNLISSNQSNIINFTITKNYKAKLKKTLIM